MTAVMTTAHRVHTHTRIRYICANRWFARVRACANRLRSSLPFPLNTHLSPAAPLFLPCCCSAVRRRWPKQRQHTCPSLLCGGRPQQPTPWLLRGRGGGGQPHGQAHTQACPQVEQAVRWSAMRRAQARSRWVLALDRVRERVRGVQLAKRKTEQVRQPDNNPHKHRRTGIETYRRIGANTEI
jgi:hypothetical protein